MALAVEQSAQVIRMRVGDQHLIDLLGRVAGAAQVFQHMPQARAKAARGAGIHQREHIAALHQIGVDRGLQALRRFGHVARSEQRLLAGVVDTGQLGACQRHHAIEQGGDPHLADGLVIDARHLADGRGLRAGGQGRGRQQQRRQDEGAGTEPDRDHDGEGKKAACRGAAIVGRRDRAQRSIHGVKRSRRPADQALPIWAGSRP